MKGGVRIALGVAGGYLLHRHSLEVRREERTESLTASGCRSKRALLRICRSSGVRRLLVPITDSRDRSPAAVYVSTAREN